MASTDGDPRPTFARAAEQTRRQLEHIADHHLGRPTPCGEYDVRDLARHVIAVVRKIAVVGDHGDPGDVVDPATDVTDDWAGEFQRSAERLAEVWSPDAKLGEQFTLAWAELQGREVLDAYTHELTAHSWDLARSLDTTSELDDTLAVPALAWFAENVPPGERGDRFADPTDVPGDADDYTRLAAFLGREV